MLRLLTSFASPQTQWNHTTYRQQAVNVPISLTNGKYPLIESPFSQENTTRKISTSTQKMLRRAVARDLRKKKQEKRKEQEIKKAAAVFFSLIGFNADDAHLKVLDTTGMQKEKIRLQEIQDDLFQNPILPKLKDLLNPATKQEAFGCLQEFKQKINEAFELSSQLGIEADSGESLGVINRQTLISVAFLLLIIEEQSSRDGQTCFGGIILLNNLFKHSFITPDETIQNLSHYFNQFSPELRSQSIRLIENVISSPLSKSYKQHIYALSKNKNIHPEIALVVKIQTSLYSI